MLTTSTALYFHSFYPRRRGLMTWTKEAEMWIDVSRHTVSSLEQGRDA